MKPYSKDDCDYIMANYGKKDLWLIAWTLRRTEKSIKQKINKLLKSK